MNPFFENYNTKYNSIPFSKIKPVHYMPAFLEGIKKAELDIEKITANKIKPNFKNTIVALENKGELLKKVSKVFYNLKGAHTSKEIQKIAKEIAPIITKHYNNNVLNEDLFKRIKFVFDNEFKALKGEDKQLLEDTYKYYIRNGANLNDTDKTTLRTIDEKLSKLSLTFDEHILEEINKFEYHVTDENELAGLTTGAKDAAAFTAKQKGKEGWIFTLNAPSYLPLLQYADNRELRKIIHKASTTKACKGDDLDNRKIIKEIIALRFQRANLLGFKNHAEFILANQMATEIDTVNNFLEDLLKKAKPFAEKEHQQLTDFSIRNGGPSVLEAYDSMYYSEKLKKELFDINDEELKPYFKLENVINGAFIVAEKLYGLKFEEINDVDKYHPDVRTYKVTDENNEFVALFYADYFPRKSKQSGAWMNSLKSQRIYNGENERPHIINVCNFTKPTETKPSLLTFNEVLTLFHEFGHGLHGMLANSTYQSLSGTSVYRDFVELPSQILENWCYEKECLDLFAFHYETGEVIPSELIEKLKASSNYREATSILRQINFASLDLAYHTINPEELKDVRAFEIKNGKETTLFPVNDYSCFSTAFGHIFAGGYSAGYYSYKWAEVLDADAFEVFKEKGIFNRELGEKFKECILSKGGSKHPMELYKDFRGTEPDNTALLKRAGILELV